MSIAQRISSKSPSAAIIAALTAALLSGCAGRNICDLRPVHYPVTGEPQDIFIDPVGYRYTDIVPYKMPVFNQPLRRDERPNYPINGPSPRPTAGPAAGTGTPLSTAVPPNPANTPAAPADPTRVAPPAPVKPQAALRANQLRAPAVPAPWVNSTTVAPAPDVATAVPTPPAAAVIEGRSTIDARRGTTN